MTIMDNEWLMARTCGKQYDLIDQYLIIFNLLLYSNLIAFFQFNQQV
jgi:hypothetical protein